MSDAPKVDPICHALPKRMHAVVFDGRCLLCDPLDDGRGDTVSREAARRDARANRMARR